VSSVAVSMFARLLAELVGLSGCAEGNRLSIFFLNLSIRLKDNQNSGGCGSITSGWAKVQIFDGCKKQYGVYQGHMG
jgi:hypothetical protein